MGATDESHIVRAIEYWDIERKRYPQYEHAAVIVAEEITSRFLNVIQLFNGTIPLIALKMTVYKVGDEYALTFVKVLDEMSFGLVDEDEPISEPTDRAFWEAKGTKKTMATADKLQELVKEVEPNAAPKYNKHYIGVEVDGSPLNFVTFVPRKVHVIMHIRLAKSDEYDEQLDDVGIETLSYDSGSRRYRLKVDRNFNDKQREVVLNLMRKSRDSFGKPS